MEFSSPLYNRITPPFFEGFVGTVKLLPTKSMLSLEPSEVSSQYDASTVPLPVELLIMSASLLSCANLTVASSEQGS